MPPRAEGKERLRDSLGDWTPWAKSGVRVVKRGSRATGHRVA